MIYNDKSFGRFLEKDGSAFLRNRNLQVLRQRCLTLAEVFRNPL